MKDNFKVHEEPVNLFGVEDDVVDNIFAAETFYVVFPVHFDLTDSCSFGSSVDFLVELGVFLKELFDLRIPLSLEDLNDAVIRRVRI